MGEANVMTVLNVEKTYSGEWVKSSIKDNEQIESRMWQRAIYPRRRCVSCEGEEEKRTGK